MTNETELKVEDRLKQAEEILGSYCQSIGLNAITYCNEVSQILQLKSEELKKLSQEDLLSYGYILTNYSAFLSKEKNIQSTKLKWARHNLNIVIGKVYSNYTSDKFMKHEVREILIIEDNEYAGILNKIMLQASSRIEQINGIDFQISKMADFLKELAKAKRYSNYE